MKKIILLFFMLILGYQGFSQIVENFDDPSVTAPTGLGPWTLPSGTWQILDNGIGSINWTLSSTGAYPANTNPNAAYINRQNIGAGNTSEDYLVTPLVNIPPNPQLIFNTRTTLAGNQNTVYEVRAALGSSDPTNLASYTILLGQWNDDVIVNPYDTYGEITIDLPAIAEPNIYIAFVKKTTQPTGAQTGDRWLIDDIRFIEKCQDADEATLVAQSTLATSATLVWDGTGNNQWEVHVLLASDVFDPNVGTPIVVNGTPQVTVTSTTQPTATPLTPLTQYVFYVRSVCDFSNGEWIGPSDTFTTQALPPECGGNFVDPGGAGGNYAANTNSTVTICPDTPGDLVTVTFTSFQTEANFDALYVFDGNSTSSPQIASTNGAANVPGGLAGGFWGAAIPGPFTSSSADGCLTFNFRSDGSVQQAGWSANVTCGPPPACPKPTAVIASNVTATTAVLNWTNVGPGTSWEVIALPCTAPPPTAATVGTPVSGTTYTFTDLNSSTCYNFYVRADCTSTSNGMSDWSIPASATTQIAPPECGGTFVDAGGPGNYANNSNVTWTICPDTPGDIVTVTFTSFQTEANFDALYVFNGNSTSAPQIASTNGAANVPGGLAGGFWGGAIPGPFESSSADGCLTFNFRSDGSVVQAGWVANVTCGPPPTCPKPTAFTATAPTSSSVVLTWTNVGPGTAWEVIALPCGSPAPDASTVGIPATSPYTYTDLDSSTCYDFYVRAICDASTNDISLWTGPSSQTTLIAPPECGNVFVDEGGPANYPANSNVIWTICPDNPGDIVTVTFTAFQTETNWDALYVFDGNSTSAPQIASTNGAGNVPGGLPGGFWGNTIPGPFESSSSDGCLTFWFRSDGSVQQAGWTANVTCNPPPTCVKPNELAANNITPVSASLAWNQQPNAEGFIAQNWEILVLPQGAPLPTTAGIPTSNPYIANGLQPGTCYTYYVRAICSDTDFSAWAGPFNFCTTPLNDDCANAVTVPVNQDLLCAQVTQGTLAGATASGQATTCTAPANDDVWYQFTATADTHVISFSSITPNTGLTFGLYQGDNCGNLTQVSCSTNNSLIADTLIPGQHYYINVYSTATQPQTSTFNLCIGTVPCNEAPSFCSSQPVTYANATNVPSLGQIGCLFTTPNPAFFFLQVNQAGPLNYLITQSTTPGGGPNLDVDYVVWGPFPDNATACAAVPSNPLPQGTCPALHACSYSAAPTETMCLPNAQLCEVYVVMITNFANQAGYVTFTQTNTTNPGAGTTECYPDTTFNYDQVSYCQNDEDPTPVLVPGAVSGAVYTSTPGLVIDPVTGTIDLSASIPGAYVVTSTYSITGEVTCTNFTNIVRTRTVIITEVPNATIAYSDPSYCKSADVQPATTEGTPGGIFSATPPGLLIDAFSGAIVPAASAAGVYTVSYTIAASGGCDEFVATTQVEILDSPNVTAPPSAAYCDEYVLPVLAQGSYYSEAGGMGDVLDGTTITATQTIYVYATNGICSDEDVFTVTINSAPDLGEVNDVSACDSYTVPTPAVGNYYDAAGGTGNVIDGTVITASTTIYLYAAEGDCVSEATIDVVIGNLVIPDPSDVTACDSYILPNLPMGNYFSESMGNGTPMFAGDVITSNQTVYVYAVDGTCSAEQSFDITILATPDLGDLPDVAGCTNYVLGTPAVGNYFDAPGGTGNSLDGVTLTTDTTVYVYASNGICTAEDSFEVTIGQIFADVLPDVTVCDSYVLPALSGPSQSYHTGAGCSGTALSAGDVLTSTQTVYVCASLGDCSDGSEFLVTVNQTPVLSPVQDVAACDSYVLPPLSVGSYYSSPGGMDPVTDPALGPGTHTVYVYASTGTVPDCFSEASFTVTVTGTPAADQLQDVSVCQGQGYVLPALSAGNAYFGGPGGTGASYSAGDQVTSTTQLYVLAAAAGNASCFSETTFTVTVAGVPEFAIEGGCQGNAYVLTATPVGGSYDPATALYQWSTVDGQIVSGFSESSVTVSGAGTYTLTVTAQGCQGTGASSPASTSCTIQKGISANGDGTNDFFDLEGFNVRRLQIFNRYGSKVYERSGYVNQWKGQSDKGEELPDGTYYYVIERNDGEPTRTGWIYINRKN